MIIPGQKYLQVHLSSSFIPFLVHQEQSGGRDSGWWGTPHRFANFQIKHLWKWRCAPRKRRTYRKSGCMTASFTIPSRSRRRKLRCGALASGMPPGSAGNPPVPSRPSKSVISRKWNVSTFFFFRNPLTPNISENSWNSEILSLRFWKLFSYISAQSRNSFIATSVKLMFLYVVSYCLLFHLRLCISESKFRWK